METWKWILIVIVILVVLGGIGFLIWLLLVNLDPIYADICPNTMVDPPTDVSAASFDGKTIHVTWTPNSSVTGYNVYVSKTQTEVSGFDYKVINFPSDTQGQATVGPFPIGTYYIKVAGYIKYTFSVCRSQSQPTTAIPITLSGTVQPIDVQIYLDNRAYGKCQIATTDWFMSTTGGGCVSLSGNNCVLKSGKAVNFRNFKLNQPSSQDQYIFTMTGYTNTYIRLKSDPSKYLVVSSINGDNNPCVADGSCVAEEHKRWTYNLYNTAYPTLSLADGSAFVYGYVYAHQIDHPYGPYVTAINPVSPGSSSCNCLPNPNCCFDGTCLSGPSDSLFTFVWKIVPVS